MVLEGRDGSSVRHAAGLIDDSDHAALLASGLDSSIELRDEDSTR